MMRVVNPTDVCIASMYIPLHILKEKNYSVKCRVICRLEKEFSMATFKGVAVPPSQKLVENMLKNVS